MSARTTQSAKSSANGEHEHAILSFWVQVSDLLDYPRSVGQIFGLIFLSETPLSADDFVRRLNISRSGAGQGLKALQDIGAIKSAHQLTSRKEHFQMQTDLGVLVKLLLNARILPKLEELSQQRQKELPGLPALHEPILGAALMSPGGSLRRSARYRDRWRAQARRPCCP